MKIMEVISYPIKLLNEREIAGYIESISSDYVDIDQIEEYLGRDTSAILKMVPVSQLRPGNPDVNIRDKRKEYRYSKMNSNTIPPLVIWNNGEIIDGNHRYRVAISKNISELPCYVIEQN